MNNTNRPQKLAGMEGLFTAVIFRAVKDALDPNDIETCLDAWAYFRGKNYQNHLAWLGLPENIRPEPVEPLTIDILSNLCKHIRRRNNEIQVQGD